MTAGTRMGPWTLVWTRQDLLDYRAASQDDNPIHYDDAAARAVGLPGVVAHGMLNMGAVSRLIVESLPFGTTVEEYQVRFRQVVPPDQPLTVTAEVVQSENERLTVAIQCTLEPDQLAISGRMVLRTPSTRAEPDHPIP